jgi:hypothetical protein
MGDRLRLTLLLCRFGLFLQVPLAGNCKLATKLQTKKSMWEMRKVPQPLVLGSSEYEVWVQSREFGLYSLDTGVWSLESGFWSLESGVWSLESGVWSLESGVWSLI